MLQDIIQDYITQANGDFDVFHDLVIRGIGYEPYRNAAFSAWEKHHNCKIGG